MANLQLLPYAQQVAAIERQRKLANLLQEQGMQPSTTQMVSGIAVPTSPWESASKLAQNIASIYAQSKADEREAATKKQAREEANKQIQGFVEGIGPQKVTTQTPVMEQDFGQAATPEVYQNMMNNPQMGLAPKRRDMSQAATPEDVQDIVNQPYVTQDVTSYKPGMNRSQALAKLLEMKSSDNPYLADATSVLSGLLPKDAEIGAVNPADWTPQSLQKYKETGNYNDLEARTETKAANLQHTTREFTDKSGNKWKQDYAWDPTSATMQPVAKPYMSEAYKESEGTWSQPVTMEDENGKLVTMQFNSKGASRVVSGLKTPDRPMTEYEGQSALFADRVRDTLSTFDAPYIPSTKESVEASIPLVGNQMITSPARQFMQAERNFINAVLRRESGATISPAEFENARKQYIPQPGDDQKTLEMKKRNREVQLHGLVKQAGRSYIPYSANSEMPAGFEPVGGT